MKNLNDDPRGGTFCMSSAGLVIGDGAKTGPAIAAPNGAGIDFVIDGRFYHKADAATVLPLSAGTTVPVLSKCLFLMCVDVDGNVTSIQSNIELTTDLAAGNAKLEWPVPTEGLCPFGAVKVQTTNAATFVPGTTALDAGDITETYYNLFATPINGLTS